MSALVEASSSPFKSAAEREREREDKREALLSAAVTLFNRKGFSATSLDEVAISLSVTKPTIYNYFASKDDILFECARRGLFRIREAAEAVRRRGGSGRDRLAALMRDYALVMTEDFGICVIRTPEHELSPQSRQELRALKREIDDAVRAVVAEGMADGSLRKGDPRLATFFATGALNWIARWYDPAGPMPAEAIAEAATDFVLGGLEKRAGAGGRHRQHCREKG